MSVPNMPIGAVAQAGQSVSHCCALASYLAAQSLITSGQATGLLNAYNSAFGAAAASLAAAAGGAQLQMESIWYAGTLPTALLAFNTAAAPFFLDTRPNDHPIGNWLAIIAAIGATNPTG